MRRKISTERDSYMTQVAEKKNIKTFIITVLYMLFKKLDQRLNMLETEFALKLLIKKILDSDGFFSEIISKDNTKVFLKI